MTIEEIEKLDEEQCPTFASFAKDKLPMPGKKKFMKEVLGKEITITDFRILSSKKRVGTECMQLQFLMNKEICILFTGSAVLADQVSGAKGQMPFRTTISQIDKFYSLS